MSRLLRFAIPSAVAVLLCVGAPTASAFDYESTWPQWRGPLRNGHVAGPVWPKDFKGGRLEKLWRVELGPGYSGPLVIDSRVYVAETVDGNMETVRALDRADGSEIWSTAWEAEVEIASVGRIHGGWIKSTPAYDEGRLYIQGMREELICLDAATGEEQWRIDFRETYQTEAPPFGGICSPLVSGDHVYAQAARRLIKIEKKTGKIVWANQVDEDVSYSSPVHAVIHGTPQIITCVGDAMIGIDPETGETLWTQEVEINNSAGMALTPVVQGNRIFVSGPESRSILAKISKDGDTLNSELEWRNKISAYMSSPVIVGNHVYMHLKNQRLACIDLKSGEETWISTKRFGQHLSMAAQGDRILCLNDKGDLFVMKANPEAFELIDLIRLEEKKPWAYIGLAHDELYVRGRTGLTVYRWHGE